MPELEPLFYLSAFFAGVLMFLAPCTLPLLPAYLGYISGVTEKEVRCRERGKRAKWKVFKHGAMFVVGFSLVFLSTGVGALFFGGYVSTILGDALQVIGGALVIVFGLLLLFGAKIPFLGKERRVQTPQWLSVGTPISSLLLGGAFAVGWSPCIGPVYGTILIYVSTSETVLLGIVLLFLFLTGFSVPFLLSAVLIGRVGAAIDWIAPYLRVISIIGGFLLILLGVTLIVGHSELTNWFYLLFEHLDFEDVLMPYL